jgi:hypothetical protein
MDSKDIKQQRIKEVQALLEDFSKRHLSSELSNYVFLLWAKLGRKRNYVITSGKNEIWAAAVVYVIARLNFLFDKSSSDYLGPDLICECFGANKKTVASRATAIEKECKIRIGHEGLCSEEISDSLTSVQLPNKMIVTKDIAKKLGYL